MHEFIGPFDHSEFGRWILGYRGQNRDVHLARRRMETSLIEVTSDRPCSVFQGLVDRTRMSVSFVHRVVEAFEMEVECA